MGKLWYRTQDAQGKSQLHDIALDNGEAVREQGPILIYLSGFLTNDNQPGYIAGGIKRMEELLAERHNHPNAPQPRIYAWSHSSLANLFNLAAYNICPNKRASKAGYDLSAGLLMPLVAKGFARHQDGSVSGTPLPPEEAAKNLRRLTLFGYSAGSIVAQETFNATLKMMASVGYDETSARRMLKEVVLVSAGTISRPKKETDRFSTIYLVASNDRINRLKNWLWGTMGTALRTLFTRYGWKKHSKDLTIRPLSASSIFASAAVRPTLYEWRYGKDGGREKKWFDPLYPKWTFRRSYHELAHYLTTDAANNPFARIVLYALDNAIGRTHTPAPMTLIQPPAHDTDYAQRLEKAIRPAPAGLR